MRQHRAACPHLQITSSFCWLSGDLRLLHLKSTVLKPRSSGFTKLWLEGGRAQTVGSGPSSLLQSRPSASSLRQVQYKWIHGSPLIPRGHVSLLLYVSHLLGILSLFTSLPYPALSSIHSNHVSQTEELPSSRQLHSRKKRSLSFFSFFWQEKHKYSS